MRKKNKIKDKIWRSPKFPPYNFKKGPVVFLE